MNNPSGLCPSRRAHSPNVHPSLKNAATGCWLEVSRKPERKKNKHCGYNQHTAGENRWRTISCLMHQGSCLDRKLEATLRKVNDSKRRIPDHPFSANLRQ